MKEENEKAIKLLAIRNASGIKGRIEEQQNLKDTARRSILSDKCKDSSSGKTNQEKIEEYKDKYKYNAFDVMLILPALVKFFLNKSKSNKLKELNEDIEKKVEEQINDTAKAFYGNDKDMDEAIRQEMYANMKNNVNELVGKIIEKNKDLTENLEKSGAILDKSGLERLLSSQIREVVNNDASLKAYFDTSTVGTQVSGQAKADANLILQNQQQNSQCTVDLGKDEMLIKAVKAACKGDKTIDLSKNENRQIAIKIASVPDGQQFKFVTGTSATVTAVKEGSKLRIC